MRFLGLVFRLALLAGIALSVLLLWVYGMTFLPVELRSHGLASAVATVLSSLVTLCVLVLAPALPIRTLFPSRPLAAAMAAGWLPLAAVVLQVIQSNGMLTAAWAALSVIKALICWIAVVAGAGLAARGMLR